MEYQFKKLAEAMHYDLYNRGLLDTSAKTIGEEIAHRYNLRAKYYVNLINWDYQKEMEEDGCIPYHTSLYVTRFDDNRPYFIDYDTGVSDHKLCGHVVEIKVRVYVGQNDLQKK